MLIGILFKLYHKANNYIHPVYVIPKAKIEDIKDDRILICGFCGNEYVVLSRPVEEDDCYVCLSCEEEREKDLGDDYEQLSNVCIEDLLDVSDFIKNIEVHHQ